MRKDSLRVMVPSSAAIMPRSAFAVVVLPEPLGPIMVTISPASIDKDTPRTRQPSCPFMPRFLAVISMNGAPLFGSYMTVT